MKEDNKEIAEFVGATCKSMPYLKGETDVAVFKSPIDGLRVIEIDKLKYHSSWDWLMPVAQKILSINTGSFNVFQLYVGDALSTSEILAVHSAVVQFIKWYKTQQV